MEKQQANNEISYRVIKIVLSTLLSEGLLNDYEFEDARRELIVKLKPPIGSLE
mgnify:CR=1 FL=1